MIEVKQVQRFLLSQVEMLLSCAMSPAMLDVRVTWLLPSNHRALMIPTALPPVFLHQTFTVFIMISRARAKTSSSSSSSSSKPVSAVTYVRVQ